MDGKKGPYSRKTKFNDRFRDTCVNKMLVKKGSYTIQKLPSRGIGIGIGISDWEFEAILTKKGICYKEDIVLSYLKADMGGVCNEVKTFPESYRCGLATALMEFCFTDPDIGTLNPATSGYFQKSNADDSRMLAISNCDHIVYLMCSPLQTIPYTACSAYLTAALNTDHTMMFTYNRANKNSNKNNWDVLKVTTAKLMLKSNADDFIDDYGDEWFFCKCKSEKVTQCEQM